MAKKNIVENTKVFSKRIRQLVIDEDITCFQLSVDVDVSPSTVHGWMYATRKPQIDNVIEISKVYGVSCDWILGLSDEK